MNVSNLGQIRRIARGTRARALALAPVLCWLLASAAWAAPAAAPPEPGAELQAAARFTRPDALLTMDASALKASYLTCDRESSERMLGLAEAAVCSHVGEALLTRGFGGDFNGLLAWWREEKALRLGVQIGARPGR